MNQVGEAKDWMGKYVEHFSDTGGWMKARRRDEL